MIYFSGVTSEVKRGNLEVCPLTKTKLIYLDFVLTDFLWNCFKSKTSDMNIVETYQQNFLLLSHFLLILCYYCFSFLPPWRWIKTSTNWRPVSKFQGCRQQHAAWCGHVFNWRCTTTPVYCPVHGPSKRDVYNRRHNSVCPGSSDNWPDCGTAAHPLTLYPSPISHSRIICLDRGAMHREMALMFGKWHNGHQSDNEVGDGRKWCTNIKHCINFQSRSPCH